MHKMKYVAQIRRLKAPIILSNKRKCSMRIKSYVYVQDLFWFKIFNVRMKIQIIWWNIISLLHIHMHTCSTLLLLLFYVYYYIIYIKILHTWYLVSLFFGSGNKRCRRSRKKFTTRWFDSTWNREIYTRKTVNIKKEIILPFIISRFSENNCEDCKIWRINILVAN